MNKKRGLGKGLDALFPGTAGEKDGRLREISMEDVVPNPRQPRQKISGENIVELADSIKEHGVVQPIVVRPAGEGKYQIVAGERRWRACKDLGLQKIPAVIREYGDLEAAAVALIENVQRENLNPLEEARAYKILMEDFGLTQEDVSKRVGKSRPLVGNMVRLLSLPLEVQEMVMEDKLTAGHARAILGVEDSSQQIRAAQQIIEGQMNVRQTEDLVKKMATEKNKVPLPRRRNTEYRVLERELSTILAAKVKVREKKDGGGSVVVDFKNPSEMVRFLNVLKGEGNSSGL